MYDTLAPNDLQMILKALDTTNIVDVTDGNGKILYVNQRFTEETGYTLEELEGKTHRVVNSGYHSKAFFKELWKTLLAGKTWSGEIRNRKKTGEFYWIQAAVTPFLAETPEETRFVAIHQIITAAKKDEQDLDIALRELEDRNFALDQTAIVAVTDVSGVITAVNQKFCDISKYSQEELIGQTHRIINSGFHSKEFFKDMWGTIVRGKVWRGEVKNRAKDHSIYWVDTTIIPFLDEDGRPLKYTAIRQDITEKKMAAERIEKERAKASYAEKMASLGEMSAGIAHELGNPLGAMRGRLEMLGFQLENEAMPFDRSNAGMMVQKVISLIDRMTGIIRGLRSYARDGSNDPFSPTNLRQLVNDILDFSADKFRKIGLQQLELDLEQNVMIECREAEVGQVIVNLISNACDAVKDLEEKWLKVVLQKEEDGVFLSITDSGTGIPEENLRRIFEPYYTSKPVGRGTGLGLSISKSILNAHNGSLEVDRECPNTRFIVRLPYKP